MSYIFKNIPGYSCKMNLDDKQTLADKVWGQMLIDNPSYNK